MTNWKDAFDSPFLSSYELDGPVNLTIDRVEQKEVQLSKREVKNVAYFKESMLPTGRPIKPMILNSGNCKMLHNAVKSGDVNKWVNIGVELSVKPNKGRIGEAQGLAINRVLSVGSATTTASNTKTELVVGSDKWEGVVQYVKSNKTLGLGTIINNLQTKYEISTAVKKELGKYVE